jgi:hypothetical protein
MRAVRQRCGSGGLGQPTACCRGRWGDAAGDGNVAAPWWARAALSRVVGAAGGDAAGLSTGVEAEERTRSFSGLVSWESVQVGKCSPESTSESALLSFSTGTSEGDFGIIGALFWLRFSPGAVIYCGASYRGLVIGTIGGI